MNNILNKLKGGVSPYMMGLVFGIAIVSTLTGNQAKQENLEAEEQYIEDKKQYLKNLANSVVNAYITEEGSSSSSEHLTKAHCNVYTNIFNISDGLKVAEGNQPDGEKNTVLTIDSNEYKASQALINQNSLSKDYSDGLSIVVNEENTRKTQINKSYQNMKHAASDLYNKIIDEGISKLPETYNALRTDVWGNPFTYTKFDDFNARLEFSYPWDETLKQIIAIKLPKFTGPVLPYVKIEVVLGSTVYNESATYYLTGHGELYATGKNAEGHFGFGDTENKLEFTKLPIDNVKDFATNGGSMYVIKNNGELWVAGSNKALELGLDILDRNVPVFTKTVVPNAKEVIVSAFRTSDTPILVLTEDGQVWGAGDNRHYALGDRQSGRKFSYRGLSNIKKVYNLFYASYAISESGELFVTGKNEYGSLGINNAQPVYEWTSTGLTNVKRVLANEYSAVAITNDNRAYVAGKDSYGMFGFGPATFRTFRDIGFDNVQDLKFFDFYNNGLAFVIFNDGTAKAAGYNNYGQLGVGSSNSSEPRWVDVPVQNIKTVDKYSNSNATYLLTNTGDLYSAGGNSAGALCLGDKVDRNIFTKLNVEDVKEIKIYEFSLFIIKKNGEIFACGDNMNGHLGVGNKKSPIIPKKVENIGKAVFLTSNASHSVVLDEDDLLYTVGKGASGALGNGSTESATSFINVTKK